MSKLIGIIADDLTGANDSGVQLTEKGINTSVLFDIPEHTHDLDSGLVIDTNSRSLSNQVAKSETKQAALFLKEAGYRYVYKKMDSTLRGHIGTELQALSEVYLPEFIIIAPAFPAYGRTTKDGVHYVNGVKLSDTEVAKDPKHPVKESYIPRLIENEIGEAVGLLTKVDINGSSLREKLQTFKEKNIQYVVCDAESQEELQQMAQQMVSISEQIIWAGSAGLAEVLPEVLGIGQQVEARSFTKTANVLTVCGSLSQVTQSQVKFAAEQADVFTVELDPVQMFTDKWKTLREGYIEECVQRMESGDDVVVYVPSNEQVREQVKQVGSEWNLSDNQIGERISQAIGEIVNGVSEKNENLSGLVLTGGDTAKDAARQLGGIGFRLIKQLEAGIPLGTLIGTEKEFKVVTKAGAFGSQQSIYQAMQVLKGVSSDE
ncbi:four-carbon acid sugar kinase family protein [Gracilibacillus sp. YIM 98692]|uniref:four-carbon acid sugar kinase family protein n=1 Tax=Gracilibacillus sp. YIM 98692 TaxID=2663532 RepID=UPI0013D66CCA|nr:four-carbon acid sugar kinase family protein [Gracilibacillus sp. YIM 98692]